MSLFLKNSFGLVGAATLLFLALPACAQEPSVAVGNVPSLTEQIDDQSVSGSFLSGTFATTMGDHAGAMHYMEKVLRDDPDDMRIAGQLLILKLMDGQIQEAVILAQKLQETDDRALIADLLLAVEHVRLERYAEASALLNNAVKGNGNFWFPLIQAWLDATQGNLKKPLEAIDFTQDPSKTPNFLYYHLALINDFAGYNEAAERQYELATADLPHSSYRSVEALADFYSRQNQPDKREALLKNYANARPESTKLFGRPEGETPSVANINNDRIASSVQDGIAEILFTMASVLFTVDAGSDTLLYLQMALHLEPNFPAAQLMLAKTLETNKSYVAAADAYSTISPDSPLYQSALLRKAFMVEKQGRLNDALQMLDAMSKQSPENSEPYIAKGDLLRSKSRFKEAAAAYTEALKRLPEINERLWPLFFARGACYERVGEWTKAEADFKQALTLNPEQPEVLNYLGYMWLSREEHVGEAKAMIERAYAISPEETYIIDSMGWAFYKTGDLESAIRLLEQAIDQSPSDASINDHLGDAYWQSGRHTEARYQWERALVYSPEPALESAIRKKIKSGLSPYPYAVSEPQQSAVEPAHVEAHP